MIVIDKWPGLITNASPYGIPPGAAVTAVNVQFLTPGEMTVRQGHAAVTWSSGATGASAVRVMFRAPCKTTERLIYQDAAGVVRQLEGPS
jgi:hypothetical protein